MTDPAAPVGLPGATREPVDRLWSCGCGWSFFTDDPVQGAAEKVEHHTSGEHLDNQLEIQRRSQAAAPVGLDLDALAEAFAKAQATPWYLDALGDGVRSVHGVRAERPEDLTLIVAAVNALPAMLDLVSRQAGVIEAARLVWKEGSAAGLDKTMGLYRLGPALAALASPALPREPRT